MDFWHSLGGMVEVTLTSADTAGSMSALNRAGIVLHGAERAEDDLTVRFRIRRQDYSKLEKITQRRGDSLHSVRKVGLYWAAKGLLDRPVILVGMLLLIMLVTVIPTRVYFFRVEGNTTVPTNLILEKCAQCGISFGASRREVRSEKLKNALLEAMPQLQWAGINTSGCVATISVRERSETNSVQIKNGVSSIVASRDGIIAECTVTRGSAACQVGQAVRAGQVLICGYTDCGISIRAERAEGEIYAKTDRDLTVKTPSQWESKGQQTEQIKKYALIIGKKRINLYKGSGISDTTCDKMYLENYVTLPGGFVLPVAIVTEVWTYRQTNDAVLQEDAAEYTLSSFAERYLSSQMVAGRITDVHESLSAEDGVFTLTGKYACLEMIGIVQNEEMIVPNGKRD